MLQKNGFARIGFRNLRFLQKVKAFGVKKDLDLRKSQLFIFLLQIMQIKQRCIIVFRKKNVFKELFLSFSQMQINKWQQPKALWVVFSIIQ